MNDQPTAAQLAQELPAPMTPREFSERYKISKKTAYAVLRSANKILIKQVKLKPEPKPEPKPKEVATPKPKQAAKKAKVKGEKSLDNFMKGILKAAKVKADRYNYID